MKLRRSLYLGFPIQALRQMNTTVWVTILQASLKSNIPSAIGSTHASIIKSGFHGGVFLVNLLMNAYAQTGDLSDARRVFDEMHDRNVSSYNTILSVYAKQGMIDEALRIFNQVPQHDSISWTAMIAGFNRMGRFEAAFRMFLDMVKSHVTPTEYTFTNIIASCASMASLDVGKKVHSFAVKLGLGSNASVANSLVNMYAKSGDPASAFNVADRIELKNISTWNSIISLHIQTGQLDHARALFLGMKERDAVSWNSMISGYHRCSCHTDALDVFSEMLAASSPRPDGYTVATVLSACTNLNALRLGKQVHAYVIRNGLHFGAVVNALVCLYSKCGNVEMSKKILLMSERTNIDAIAFTALLDGYMKLGDVNPAREIFDVMGDRDVVAWTAMIVGYAQNGDNGKAVDLFRVMIEEGPLPNSHTLAAMLSITSTLASLNYGKQVHATAVKLGQALSPSVSNSLINMYAKTGNVDCARKAFSLTQERRDSVCWTSMITSLAQHGLGEEALRLFEEMLAMQVKPDHITYVGVLSACTHVGLVEEGRNFFRMMKDVHGITPTSSHCACMIDLFGRAGLLQEAHHFIQTMPVEPDIVAWGSLLASCKVHRNAEVAVIAAEKMLSLDPSNSGAYSSLANVYSACGKWEEAARIRKFMKDSQVKKEQGISWLEVKNEVHTFGADDVYHPQRDAVYKKMSEIWQDIKEMGFVPDTGSVLHDLDNEVKEQTLKHHSEKLAIAFGLLNTPEKTPLRIMKNLRVCNDCHSAIKFIAKLVDREIIVRDATRFHHFKNGSCSCRDYW